MSARLVWVVGRGGLLGSAVERAFGSDTWHPERPVDWQSTTMQTDLSAALSAFAGRAAGRAWTICWCAGAGVVGTSGAALATETAVFQTFLDRLGSEPSLTGTPGQFFLASSAGGVYAGSDGRPMTELTGTRPISDYGRAKLKQEELLTVWSSRQPKISVLIGRIANLYGPGQRLGKPQGLISHMARCLIFRVPVHIYVPLDTLRDYVLADDVGRRIAAGLGRLAQQAPGRGRHVVKIYGSEREISVAGVIGVFRQVAKRQLRVVLGLHAAGAQQPVRLQFRSVVWTDEAPPKATELLEGVNLVFRHQLSLYQAGRLPAPPGLPAAASSRS